jgi:hypothetical protein
VSEPRKWILGLIAAFLFGVTCGAVGALGVVALYHQRPGPPPFLSADPGFERGDRARKGRRGDRREGRRPPMERLLTRHLDLSDGQRAAVARILDSARPRYAAIRESTHAEIDRILTPEQRDRLKQFEDRFPGERRDDRAERDAPGTP